MKILLIRMMGLGDVASIGVPVAKILRNRHPSAHITFFTYAAGGELATLIPDINQVIIVSPDEWPNDIFPAMESFYELGNMIIGEGYDQIINLDTWFMPCFLGQILKESGQPLLGNHLSVSIDELLTQLENKTLRPEFVEQASQYVGSSFPNMQDWFTPWWQQHTDLPYPQFYLNHCCGFEENIDISLDVEPDQEIIAAAAGRKILALEWSGRMASKQYPHGEQLKKELEENGYYVWRQFDGSVPMAKTLSRLAASDLLISVPTAVQWLGKLAGCPALVIPGPLPPSVLGAEAAIDKSIDCQYCFQNNCITDKNFACMDIAPEKIIEAVEHFFANQ